MKVPSDIFIYIDISILLIYALFIIVGYKKGFIFEIISIVFTGLSLLAAWFLSPVFAGLYPIIKLNNLNNKTEIINKFVNIDALLNSILYFVIIFLVLKLLYLLLSIVLKGFNKIPVIGSFNKILGAFAGVFNATLMILSLSLLLYLPIFENGEEIINKTFFKYIDEYSDSVLNFAIDNSDLNSFKDGFNDFDVDNAREEFKEWLQFKRNHE